MTVQELINELQHMPLDAEVKKTCPGEPWTVTCPVYEVDLWDHNIVVLG
jgi:hypothetical protein